MDFSYPPNPPLGAMGAMGGSPQDHLGIPHFSMLDFATYNSSEDPLNWLHCRGLLWAVDPWIGLRLAGLAPLKGGGPNVVLCPGIG